MSEPAHTAASIRDAVRVEVARSTPALLEAVGTAAFSNPRAQLETEPLLREIAELEALVSVHGARGETGEADYYSALLEDARLTFDARVLHARLLQQEHDYAQRQAIVNAALGVVTRIGLAAASAALGAL